MAYIPTLTLRVECGAFAALAKEAFLFAAAMSQYGWFVYTDDPLTITQCRSGQHLRITAGGGSTYKGIYSDAEITWTLEFQITRARFTLIEVDYRQIFGDPPSYGYWRRLDDFLTDALLCWPEFVLADQAAFGGQTTGGWFGNQWHPQRIRRFSGRKGGTRAQLQSLPLAEWDLLPLTLAAPLPWRYQDCPQPFPEAVLNVHRDPLTSLAYLPSGDPIQGFQGRVPYLEREDGQAYLFPSRLEPQCHRGEDPLALLWYTYVDEQIFFTFRTHPAYHLELGSIWDYGFRHLPPPAALCPVTALGIPIPPERLEGRRRSGLSYRIWRQVKSTLADIWPLWQPRRITLDAEQVAALPPNYGFETRVGAYGNSILGGYTGGQENTWYEVTTLN